MIETAKLGFTQVDNHGNFEFGFELTNKNGRTVGSHSNGSTGAYDAGFFHIPHLCFFIDKTLFT